MRMGGKGEDALQFMQALLTADVLFILQSWGNLELHHPTG